MEKFQIENATAVKCLMKTIYEHEYNIKHISKNDYVSYEIYEIPIYHHVYI